MAVIVAAAGRGERAGFDKLWVEVAGRPVIAHTLAAIASTGLGNVIVVAPQPRHRAILEIAEAAGMAGVRCVPGGARRRDSVAAGLDAAGEVEIVVVHDGARPLAGPALFAAVIAAARDHGAATVAVPCVDTIKRVAEGMVVETLPRKALVAVQTPQAFAADLLRRAHAASDGEDAGDDCLLVERLGAAVAVVAGDAENRKITHADDLTWLRHRLERPG